MNLSLTLLKMNDSPAKAGEESLNVKKINPSSAENQSEDNYIINYLLDTRPNLIIPASEIPNSIVSINIPKNPEKLKVKIQHELKSIYKLYGKSGITQFGIGVYGLKEYSAVVRSNRDGHRDFLSKKGDELIKAMSKSVMEDRLPLWKEYILARESLLKEIASVEALVLKELVKQTSDIEIPRCKAQIIKESRRYLSFANTSDESIRHFLDDCNTYVESNQALSGPDAYILTQLLDKLKSPYNVMKQAREDSLLLKLGDKASEALLTAVYTPAMLTGIVISKDPVEWTKQKEEEWIKSRDQTNLKNTLKWLSSATNDFQELFLKYGTAYPILHKILGEDSSNPKLSKIISHELRKAWEACKELEKLIKSEPETLWTFSTFVNRTVKDMQKDDPMFVEKVASDCMVKANSKIHPFQALNYFIQGLDTSLMFVDIPIIQLGSIIVSTIGNAAELIEEYIVTSDKSNAFNASLDPSLSISSEQSFLGLGFSIAFTALCLLPVPGLLKEIRNEVDPGKMRKIKLVP